MAVHPAVERLRLAVLISGGGTNLQALIDRSRDGRLNADVVVVGSDRADAYGLVRAKHAGIPSCFVDYGAILRSGAPGASAGAPSLDLAAMDEARKVLRIAEGNAGTERLNRLIHAERQLISSLEPHKPDLICLAGFMRLVSPHFIQHYNGGGTWRILNIHPAMLPAFPGQHGYEDTFRYGCRWGGVSVHFVDEGEDTGPLIAQAAYPIWPNDTLETVRNRGLSLEYKVYSQCINWIAAGQIELETISSRPTTRIKDPLYPNILKAWLDIALREGPSPDASLPAPRG